MRARRSAVSDGNAEVASATAAANDALRAADFPVAEGSTMSSTLDAVEREISQITRYAAREVAERRETLAANP